MNGYSVSQAAHRIAFGEYDQLWTPRSPRTGTCGVVLCHGSGAPLEYLDGSTQPASVAIAAALASAGIPCISGDLGGQAWGNDTHMARIDSAIGVLRGAFPKLRTDKFLLIGASMGGLAATRYTQLHPDRIAACVGLIPLCDLVSFYAAQTTAVRAEVAAAWGVAAGAALPAAADNAAGAHLAASVPFLAGYSTVDVVVRPAWVTAYAAAVGGTAIVTDGAYGHSDQAIGGMPLATLKQFLVAHGA